MYRRNFIFLLIFLFNRLLFSQDISEKGLPYIQNFLPENYGNHGKIWQTASAKNGLVYMASDNGLLEFDGQNWNRFRDYPGYTRSLCILNDSVIFVGADMDFGVWKKKGLGKFSFTSYYPYKKRIGGTNEEFWGTYQIDGKIIFVSHQNIYILKQGKISKISARNRFSNSFQHKGKIFVTDEKNGIYEFDGTKLRNIYANSDENAVEISGFYSKDNLQFVVTKDKGIFQLLSGKLLPLQTEISPELIKNKVFSFSMVENQLLIFGTILNGIYISDLNGKILQHLNKKNGLLNNTVLSIHQQKNGKMWLGLDYGISSVNIKDNITYFHSNNEGFGTGYTALHKDETLYLGTNQGLYTTSWKNLNGVNSSETFKILQGSEGQVWNLTDIDGEIFCGHDKGLFKIEGQNFIKIYDEPGVQSILKYGDNFLFASSYNGISIFKNDGHSWKFFKKMSSIVGSVNQIVAENNKFLWANIPNFGFVRFSLDQNLNPVNRKIYNSKNLKGYFPYIFKDEKGIHAVTSVAQYIFEADKRKFTEEARTLQSAGVKGILPGFYTSLPISETYGFYPVNNGFALEKLNSKTQNLKLDSKVVFRGATAYNNNKSLNFVAGEKIPYRLNNIKISFLVPNEDGVEYQYFLEGFSDEWSKWDEMSEADFVALKEGSYILKVRAKKGEFMTAVEEYQFRINSPWYRSFWSYLGYVLLVFGLYLLLKKYQRNKLRKQKFELLKKQQNSLREQAEKHRHEIFLQKQKQLEAEKNFLKDEIKNKTIELATKAKDDEDKNRLLHTVSEKILEIEANPNISKIRLGEIRRMLKTYLETEDHTFEIQMDELHQEFFKVLKHRFPNLSIYDLRLCAYLRIGLNSKEMSEILQVLPSSINVSRSRLRKKLGLAPEVDLYEFLNQFS